MAVLCRGWYGALRAYKFIVNSLCCLATQVVIKRPKMGQIGGHVSPFPLAPAEGPKAPPRPGTAIELASWVEQNTAVKKLEIHPYRTALNAYPKCELGTPKRGAFDAHSGASQKSTRPRHGRSCIVTISTDVSANAAALRTLESGRGAKIWPNLEPFLKHPKKCGRERCALGHRSSPFRRLGAIYGAPDASRT